MFKAFTFTGRVALSQQDQTFPITILRDTGAAQSILVHDAVPNLSQKLTGEQVLLSDLSTSQVSHPLAEVYLECPFFNADVKVAVKYGVLPVKGVQLLLGNDLAGTLVVPNVTKVDEPLPEVLVKPPDVCPTSAVTRAQAKLVESTPSKLLPSLPFYQVKDDLINQPLSKEEINPLNYIIATPDQRKNTQLVHVNLLKPYYSRSPEVDVGTVLPVALCASGPSLKNNMESEADEESSLPIDIPCNQSSLSNSGIITNFKDYFCNLKPEQETDMIQFLHQFHSVTSDTPGLCNYIQHDVKLLSSCQAPIRQTPYKVHPHKSEIMEKEVNYLITHNLAEPSTSPWVSLCILVPITTIDLMKGYYQMPLMERAKEISAFITPFGLFQYKVLAFGLSNAPSTFQRVINYLIRGLGGTAAYLDDIGDDRDVGGTFHLQIDASGIGVGGVLLQADQQTNVLHPVAYHSCKLKKYQQSYSTIEKEALALVHAIQKFECYLQPSPHCVQVFTDLNPLAFINSTKFSNQRILRWALLLQSYNLQVQHIKGTDNLLADALSRGIEDDDT
ncbi:hypothetical protein Pmani_000942 [Petrolisthes manimaculis]|uniref:Reverse transcriptase RNase H-like domain-containing protein n=1 Tax=Petrolisthes manimaculis TaxID=1843537 RepID=A0AAE1QN48_9EUCA|nr:hypothetical protein Pmani_000942 [Petrolisthes manimaculis]